MQSYNLQEIEAKLKEISSDFEVRPNPNSDLAGLYWQGHFAEISMPKEKIYATKNHGYVDDYERPHIGLDDVLSRASGFIARINNDDEFRRDITTPFDINRL